MGMIAPSLKSISAKAMTFVYPLSEDQFLAKTTMMPI